VHDVTSITDIDKRGLEQAFLAFSRLSGQLEETYRALERRVAALTAELEEARRAQEREERNARRLAGRLKLLLDTLPAGVIVIDSDGLIRESNDAAAEILGPELVGKRWQSVANAAFVKETTPSGEWLTADGRRVVVLTKTLPEDSSRIVLLTDVTTTRALEDLANRNRRLSAMGKMAASLAHQIRTPLAGALLYLSQCRTCDESRRPDLLNRGIERLRDLDRLVQDMLVFTRGTGPGERLRIADLFRAVHDAAQGIKPPNAHLVIEGENTLIELDGNRTALTAALTNLVANAFEASPDVVVTLKAELRGRRVAFTVHDNGPGIAREIQSRIFEPFFSTRAAGTGLGLAVVKSVAEAHGGGLELASAPDRGTTIGIAVPCVRHELDRDVA